MAAANGRTGAGLSDQLFAEPYGFDFFQAVRVLERLARAHAGPDPRGPRQPVGRDHPPEREAVRFRAQPGLSFPAGEVSQAVPPPPDGRAASELTVSFLGLTGPQGVLPQHYTSLLLARVRNKDSALRDFLDLLNHRILSLFYRAWEKYRLAPAYERSRLTPEGPAGDLATWCLYCLVGLGTEGLRGRLDVADETFLFYAGHFAQFPRSAAALEGILADYFELPVAVLQAQGQWLALEDDDRSLMPCPGLPRGRNCAVGIDLIVGERIWDVQAKFRVRLGPLSYEQFRRFQPAGDGLRVLGQLTRTYVGAELDFDVQPVLRGAEVPWCRLGTRDWDRPYLGWNTWVRCKPYDHDVADAVFLVDNV